MNKTTTVSPFGIHVDKDLTFDRQIECQSCSRAAVEQGRTLH